MLLEYINSAMKKAHYEILANDNMYYGEIPNYEGVYTNAENIKAGKNRY